MSQVQQQKEVIYEVFAGTTKTFTTIVEDPSTGQIEDISDDQIYTTGFAEISRPDGSLLGTVNITYTDRANGIVTWTVESDITNSYNVGNWLVNVKFYNILDQKINELEASFNILE